MPPVPSWRFSADPIPARESTLHGESQTGGTQLANAFASAGAASAHWYFCSTGGILWAMSFPQMMPGLFAIDSVLPCALITLVLLGAGAVIVRCSGFYRTLVIGHPNRFGSLDGLRGFLAFAVFFCHAHVNYFFVKTGQWEVPVSRFYAGIGPVAVALFFMITGFLFWTKAIAKDGKIPPIPMYVSRFWRVAPMYVCSMLVLSVVVLSQTGMHLNVSGARLAGQLCRVFSLGLLTPKELNGIGTVPINGAVWTLYYEWIFYIALPVLALCVKPRAFLVMLGVAICLRVGISGSKLIQWMFLFAGGMTAAQLVAQERVRRLFGHDWLAAGCLVLLGMAMAYSGSPQHLVVVIPSFGLFLSLVSGASFMGLLTCPAARMLGTVSYSIYLAHGVVLYTIFRAANHFGPAGGMTPATYWGTVLGCALTVLGVSCVTYRLVEHPGIERGRRPMRGKSPVQAEAVGEVVGEGAR